LCWVDDSQTLLSLDNFRVMTDKQKEQNAWHFQTATARAALDCWTDFLVLKSGNLSITKPHQDKLLLMVRAVSWVESRHGSGTGVTAGKDPMQCGKDVWWKSISGQVGQGDRILRGNGTGYWSNELAVAVESLLPNGARLSHLQNATAGHDDPNFSNLTSYYWGCCYLIHKINRSTFQCGTLSDKQCLDGANAYNGGGDELYRAKVERALAMITSST
jgi:hypothetical protein